MWEAATHSKSIQSVMTNCIFIFLGILVFCFRVQATTNCNGNGLYLPQTGACVCNPGYYGPACIYNVSTCGAWACSGHGTCIASGDSLKPNCLCDSITRLASSGCSTCISVGFNASCTGCVSGYFGPFCNWDDIACGRVLCSSNGRCTSPDNICQCFSDYTGVKCQDVAPGLTTTGYILVCLGSVFALLYVWFLIKKKVRPLNFYSFKALKRK